MMPIVSIGMPVYNGERYILLAIESILGQTYSDFELIICDNASTDRTEEICRNISQKDSRIRYYRNTDNVGAAKNFNKVFEFSTGKYFKWAAHDDIIAPEYIEKCVYILDNDPDVVLAFSNTMVIDNAGNKIKPYVNNLPTNSSDPVERYEALLRFGHKCYEIFGVIRRSVLEETPLMGGYAHGDGVLLARLSLLGRFQEIPLYLFFARQHPEQSMSMIGDYRGYALWFNPRLKESTVFPYLRMHFEFLKGIRASKVNIVNRVRCYGWLAIYVFSRRRNLIREILYPRRGMKRKT